MSSSNSPCAACKFLRRKCTRDCVFAPYFPPDQPQKFANVHTVYGRSNVEKILLDLPIENRQDAVNSLAYEADSRLRDPVYGCIGLISALQQRLKQIHADIFTCKQELSAMLPTMNVGAHQYYQTAAAIIPPSSCLSSSGVAQQQQQHYAAIDQHDQLTMMMTRNNNYEEEQLNGQHQLLQHEFGAAGFNIVGVSSDTTVIGMRIGVDGNQYPVIQQQQEQHDDVHNEPQQLQLQIQTQHLLQTTNDNPIQPQHQPHLNHHQHEQQQQQRPESGDRVS